MSTEANDSNFCVDSAAFIVSKNSDHDGVNEMSAKVNDSLNTGLIGRRKQKGNLRNWFSALRLKLQNRIIMDAPDDLVSPLDEYKGRNKTDSGTGR